MTANTQVELPEIEEVKVPGLNWLAVLVGALIMFLGYYILYNEVRPGPEEYVPGFAVALIGLIGPALLAGVVVGLIARRSPAVHAGASVVILVLGGYVLKLVTLLTDLDITVQLSVLTVFGVAWGIGAPIGASLIGARIEKAAAADAAARDGEAHEDRRRRQPARRRRSHDALQDAVRLGVGRR